MVTPCDMTIAFRGYAEDWEGFDYQCSIIGRTRPQMLRELMRAFADGRITIEPTTAQQAAHEGLYLND